MCALGIAAFVAVVVVAMATGRPVLALLVLALPALAAAAWTKLPRQAPGP